jgi:hypothetical protein
VTPFANSGYRHDRRAPTVIQIGRDEEVSRFRAIFLASAGYTVRSLKPEQATRELGRDRGAKIWLLCHTLQFHESALLAALIRGQAPADKLLRVISLHSMVETAELFDELLEPVGSVDVLLRTVAQLATQIATAPSGGTL